MDNCVIVIPRGVFSIYVAFVILSVGALSFLLI
jgi:hypothetical protein